MYYYTRLSGAVQAARSAGFALDLIMRCFFARLSPGIFHQGAEDRFGSGDHTRRRGVGRGLSNLVDEMYKIIKFFGRQSEEKVL